MLGFLGEEREAYVLNLQRIAFAVLLFLLTLKMGQLVVQVAYFGDVFHMPLVPESWVPSRSVYWLMLGLQALGCGLALFNVRARPALLVAASLGLYGVLCNRLEYHNNRYELLLLAFLVALTPCDRQGKAPWWAVRLVGAQVSLVYLASSLGKLFDADWRGGAVLLRRFGNGIPFFDHHGLHALTPILGSPTFAHAASLAAIASELFLALGLWFGRTRALALWLGFMFHAGIEIAAHVELFSYTMIAGYIAFVTPELRERAVSWNIATLRGQRWAAFCRRLDLLARFQHQTSTTQQPLVLVTDRSGTQHAGVPAWRELARAFPPLFPLWLPLTLFTLRRPRTPKA
ncbi:MAG TPA: HTTM domain-containing protein [Polyangiaceae bacterium]|nr:HTTM domain-containing protein [Polyangiaceae bacterium]